MTVSITSFFSTSSLPAQAAILLPPPAALPRDPELHVQGSCTHTDLVCCTSGTTRPRTPPHLQHPQRRLGRGVDPPFR
eukprot:354232-Chlamydomonas_euryale.AAC.13